MIRLSRKAWNNVIIFAMLLMIFLFNASNNFLTGSDNDQQSRGLLPEHSVLMTLQSNGRELQRIGTGWRVIPPAEIEQQKLQAVVTSWQTSIMTSIQNPNPKAEPIVVVAWLAGQDKGLVFQLYQQQQDILVQHQGGWFIINNSDLGQFTISTTEENI